MYNPNISAEALHRQRMNSAHAGSRRTRPLGPIAAIGRLIGLLIMLAFLAGVGLFILSVVSRSGLG